MKSGLSLIILCIISTSFISAEVQKEDHVLVLDDSNFDEELKKHDVLFVKWYAHWCSHCKSLAPEYSLAAEILSKDTPPVYLAKIDATVATENAQKFEIQGFPTLKMWYNGEWKEYDGGRTHTDIVQWVRKRLSPPSKELKTVEDVEEFKKANDAVVISFGDVSKREHEIYVTVAKAFEDVNFGHVSDASVISHFEAQPGQIFIYKNFDEGKNKFTGEVTAEALTHFVNFFSVPIVSKFDERAAEAIFGRNKVGLFLIRSESSPDAEKLEEAFRNLAPQYREKIIFVLTDIVGEIEEKLAEYYGLTAADLPHVRLSDVKGEEDVSNYVLTGDVTQENMQQFLNDYFAGKLISYVKSEAVPEEQTEAVVKVVGRTYRQIVIENDKNVLMSYTASWCGHCQKLAPIYEKVAEHFKDDKSIVIAKIDATANDIDGLTVEGYPTIKFFLGKDKTLPVDFTGDRTYEDIVNFVNGLVYPDKYPQLEKEKVSGIADGEPTENVDAAEPKNDL
jgi:protein disulfide-isomerase A1